MGSINSLKNNRDFCRVYGSGQKAVDRLLVMYAMPNGREDTRIGISVSKKVGNSVVRHRVTRVIRECCRLHEKELKQGLDIVIVARMQAKEQGLLEIERAFFHAGKILRVFMADEPGIRAESPGQPQAGNAAESGETGAAGRQL
ncbi:MAG: ribonuclease P protein component [Lachnospiraceae bacterium]